MRPSGPKGLHISPATRNKPRISSEGVEVYEAEGYEIRAEKVLGTFMVTVRARFTDAEGSRGWSDLLAFQTTAHDWSDPHLELQSLAMQVARRLE